VFDPLQIPDVWRARSLRASGTSLPTGFADLDAALGGGWPAPALIELLTDVYGIGELQIVVPLLRELIKRGPQPSLVVWLNPPYSPNAVALAEHALHAQHWCSFSLADRDALWSTEQALRSGATAAVLVWLREAKTAALRRLKLACAASRSTAIIYRSSREAHLPSPASIRAALRADRSRLHVQLLKIQGREPCEVLLDVDAANGGSSV
jgi:protein ImuA